MRERKYYLSYNLIKMYEHMDFEEVIKEIKSKKIFDYYGAIRIKSPESRLSRAKELAQFIC